MKISRHAVDQMNRRRIGRDAVDLAIGYGTEHHCAGATFYVLRFRDIPRVLHADPEARRAEGTTVVVADGRILTVYRNRDVRHLRQKERHGRVEGRRAA
ncbi:MAG: hypothetical protein OHK0013_01830 [Sandaracinaceae bacterium]